MSHGTTPARDVARARIFRYWRSTGLKRIRRALSHFGRLIGSIPVNGGFASPDDVALVLYTSGTTSRPKIVPLTNRNICVSAGNIAETLRLTPEDRCLNVMPLFHIHGLIACCAVIAERRCVRFLHPGFNALNFLAYSKISNPVGIQRCRRCTRPF